MAERIQKTVRIKMKEAAAREGMILDESLLDRLILRADMRCPVNVDIEAFVEKAMELTRASVLILKARKTSEYSACAQ